MILYFLCWTTVSLLFFKQIKIIFVLLLLIIHVTTYYFWVKGFSKIFSLSVFLTLICFRAMTINVFLTLSCVVAIFSLLFLVKKIFPKIVGELEKDSKIIDAHWNKEFKNSSPFRETSYLMLGILGSAGSIFWEQILANDFICSLWFCLFTYSLCSFLVFEIVTLIIISICNPLTSNPLTQIG